MDTTQHPRKRPRFKPRKSVMLGAGFALFFMFGYVVNSFFYCQALFNCDVSLTTLGVVLLISAVAGALMGWMFGKFLRWFYRVTRVD